MTIGGSKGGIYKGAMDKQGIDVLEVRIWKSIGKKQISGKDAFNLLLKNAAPKQVEVGIGNTCGLQCKQCFLGYDSGQMISSLIPLERLIRIVSDFIAELSTRIICLTDRDALTPGRSMPLFEQLQYLRTIYSDLKFGGVTNGLAIHKFADDLARIKLDYLDISIDGMKKEHDAMRGAGTFDQTIENLRVAIQSKVADRVMVSTTLTSFNHISIIDLISYLSVHEKVQWFNVAPLMAVKMQQYQLNSNDLLSFIKELSLSIRDLDLTMPLTVYVEAPSYGVSFIPSLIDHGYLIPDLICKDVYGHLYQEIIINDFAKIVLRPELIPEYCRHTLRISADGYVVGACEALTQSNYHQFAVGNIKEQSAKAVYEKAIAVGSPFHKMMMAYDYSECRNKACFQHCLGGDSLLAKAVYGSYHVKDPNCTWDEYQYKKASKAMEEVALVH